MPVSYTELRQPLPMSSMSILRRHMGRYQRMWSNCSTVCSAPGVAFWAGEHNVLRGGLATCQTFPLRVYVGLEPVTVRKEISFAGDGGVYTLDRKGEKYDFFSPSAETEEEIELAHERRAKQGLLQSEISQMARVLALERGSYRIHLLSEFSPRMGGNWSGAFAAALAGALLADNGRLSAGDIEGWRTRPAWELDGLESFRVCNRWAWHFESVLHDGRASGYGTFCALAGSRYPICYVTEARGGTEDNPPIDVIRERQDKYPWGSDRTWLEEIRYSGFRFEDLWGSPGPPPAVYGLLSSGIPKDTGQRIRHTLGLAHTLETSRAATKKLLTERPEILQSIPHEKLAVTKVVDAAGGSELLTRIYDSLSVASIDVFHAVRELFYGAAEPSIRLTSLARAMSGAHGTLVQLGQNWAMAEALIAEGGLVAEEAGNWNTLAMKLTGGGGGGFLFFVGPYGVGLDRSLLGAIDSLRERRNQNRAANSAALLWTSMEGLEERGLRIEACHATAPVDSRFAELKADRTEVAVIGGRERQRALSERSFVFGYDLSIMRDSKDGVFVRYEDNAGFEDADILIGGLQAPSSFTHLRVAQMLREIVLQGGSVSLQDLSKKARSRGHESYNETQVKHHLAEFVRAVAERLGSSPALHVGAGRVIVTSGGPPVHVVLG